MLRLCGWTRLEGDVQVWPGEPDLLDTLRSRIAAAQKRGRARTDLDPAALSLMLFGLIFFWVDNRAHFAMRFKGRIDDEAFLRQAVALFEQGIAPDPKAVRRSAADSTVGEAV